MNFKFSQKLANTSYSNSPLNFTSHFHIWFATYLNFQKIYKSPYIFCVLFELWTRKSSNNNMENMKFIKIVCEWFCMRRVDGNKSSFCLAFFGIDKLCIWFVVLSGIWQLCRTMGNLFFCTIKKFHQFPETKIKFHLTKFNQFPLHA